MIVIKITQKSNITSVELKYIIMQSVKSCRNTVKSKEKGHTKNEKIEIFY